MKRKVLFALLCLGVVSVFAIAVSIPEPVRILSGAEKANVIAGCFYDCDQYCTDPGGCAPALYCQGKPIGTLCSSQNNKIRERCDIGNMLDPQGVCESPKTQVCMRLESCTCGRTGGCAHHDDVDDAFNVQWAFSHSPCTGSWDPW